MDSECICENVLLDGVLRHCPEHHVYRRDATNLVSVTQILKAVWPIKPDFSKASPEVLENARQRGIEVDALFCAYAEDRLDEIPAGTREDVVALFHKLRGWWDGHKHGEVKTQVMMSSDKVAGTCDIIDDYTLFDLKCTYSVEPSYHVQLGAYASLCGRPVRHLKIIHATKRYAEPRIIEVDLVDAIRDWMLVHDTYFMAHRRSA